MSELVAKRDDELRALSARRVRVYVAGPISLGDKQANIDAALAVGRDLISRGFAPFVPHLDWFFPDRDGVTWDQWLEIDLAFVRVCHALLRLPGESQGADLEVRVARRNRIPVFSTVEELEVWRREQ